MGLVVICRRGCVISSFFRLGCGFYGCEQEWLQVIVIANTLCQCTFTAGLVQPLTTTALAPLLDNAVQYVDTSLGTTTLFHCTTSFHRQSGRSTGCIASQIHASTCVLKVGHVIASMVMCCCHDM